jgi:uncharacterized membrane protein
VRARAASTPELVVPLEPPTAPRVLTSDDAGGVWLGEGTAISGWTLGTPMSFETDVKPVLESYCSVCHAPPGANDAPPIDFLDYDVAVAKSAQVAQRIGTGQMPPASATPLPADSHQIILRWIASGASP